VYREFRGIEAIRRWAASELAGDRVTVDLTEVLDQHGGAIVRGRYGGNCGKTTRRPPSALGEHPKRRR
jgi:hypothetical protein